MGWEKERGEEASEEGPDLGGDTSEVGGGRGGGGRRRKSRGEPQ